MKYRQTRDSHRLVEIGEHRLQWWACAGGSRCTLGMQLHWWRTPYVAWWSFDVHLLFATVSLCYRRRIGYSLEALLDTVQSEVRR